MAVKNDIRIREPVGAEYLGDQRKRARRNFQMFFQHGCQLRSIGLLAEFFSEDCQLVEGHHKGT